MFIIWNHSNECPRINFPNIASDTAIPIVERALYRYGIICVIEYFST